MKTALVFLFIVSFAISARSEKDYSAFDSIPPEPKSKFALLDDVRILANGLLQLGHGLKDFVQKTKGQINDIFRKLNIFDKSFYELSLQTNEIKEEEEELRKTTSILQVNNEEIRNISLELISRIENFMQEKIQLQEKVGELENKVVKLVHGQPVIQESKEITSLKVSKLEKLMWQKSRVNRNAILSNVCNAKPCFLYIVFVVKVVFFLRKEEIRTIILQESIQVS